jgi:hypothetical protein
MAIDTGRLSTEVGADPTQYETVLEECVDVSHELMLQYVEQQGAEVPDPVFDRAWLVVAVDLFNQSQAPNGVLSQQFTDVDGGTSSVPVRISRDPLAGAYPVLALYINPVTFA